MREERRRVIKSGDPLLIKYNLITNSSSRSTLDGKGYSEGSIACYIDIVILS